MEARARAASAGYSVHSSNAMMMSAPRPICASIALSGLKKCSEPSRWERNVTPSSFDLAQLIEAEYLKSAGVGKNRAGPRHKAVQSTQLADLLDPRSQVKVIGIAQQNLNAQFFEDVLRNPFDRGQRAHRHEDGSLHFAMSSDQTSGAGRASGGVNFELEGH